MARRARSASRAPQLMKGYLDARSTPRPSTRDGYFRTGDLGRIDADGNVIITGRVKDIIIRNMENISAKEVEDLLFTHPKVADAAVIGLPDARTGERACAVVVPRGRRRSADAAPSSREFLLGAGPHEAEAARAARARRRAAAQPHRQGAEVRAPATASAA